MGSTRKLIINNVFWKYMELFSVMGIQLLCTSIMARFLSPEDFGILGVIIVFTSLGEVFVSSGFVQTLIREKVKNGELGEDVIAEDDFDIDDFDDND